MLTRRAFVRAVCSVLLALAAEDDDGGNREAPPRAGPSLCVTVRDRAR